MREAIQISAEAHELVRESVSFKENERQIQGLLEGFFLEKGARGPAYNSIVASGDNACILHYTSNNSPLNKEDLLLVDAYLLKKLVHQNLLNNLEVNLLVH